MMLFTGRTKDKELHNDNADNLPELIADSDDYLASGGVLLLHPEVWDGKCICR